MDMSNKARSGKVVKRAKRKVTTKNTITTMLKNMGQKSQSSSDLLRSPVKIEKDSQQAKENLQSLDVMAGRTKSNQLLSADDLKKEFMANFTGHGAKKRTKRASPKKAKRAKVCKSQAITDFYHVRRSERRCQTDLKEEKYNQTIQKIVDNEESGIKVKTFSNKGRGVVSTRPLSRNDFVVEYAGDLIDVEEASRREEIYSTDGSIGCYMYYFQSRGKRFCIDATAESGRLGRLLNHSKTDPNCYTKVMWFRNEMRIPKVEIPHLTIVARRDIQVGEELTYDYGDREKKTLEAHPWLKA